MLPVYMVGTREQEYKQNREMFRSRGSTVTSNNQINSFKNQNPDHHTQI